MRTDKILLAVLIVAFCIPSLVQGQDSRYKSRFLKNDSEAIRRALIGTIVPIAAGIGTASLIESKTIETSASFLAVYGLIMGPSSGNFYAQDYLRGMLGVAARLGGGYLMLDATRELAGDDVADALSWDDKDISLTDTSVLIGGGLILGSAVYNILSSKASVTRYNKNQGYYLGLLPAVKDGKAFPVVSGKIYF